jgi:hypothetical protein
MLISFFFSISIFLGSITSSPNSKQPLHTSSMEPSILTLNNSGVSFPQIEHSILIPYCHDIISITWIMSSCIIIFLTNKFIIILYRFL